MNCTRGKLLCNISVLRCRKPILLLTTYWVCSVVAGAYLAYSLQDFFPLMHAVLKNRVSIVGVATTAFLPFILSALAAYFSLPELVYVIAAIKGVCLGFTSISLLICYADAAWLVYCLACFSSSFTLIPLFLFWIRYLAGSGKSMWCNVYRYFLYAIAIGAIDYLYVSPLISNVI